MKKFVITVLAILSLAACTNHKVPPISDLNFTKQVPIKLDVAKIEVVEAYQSPFAAPNVEHLMPYSPADAMQIWVKDRLRAVGKDNLLQVNIIDASVVASDLPKTKGLTGLFTVDQEKKLDARLEVELRLYAGGALSDADTSVTVTRSITIPENASVNARKAAYITMMQDLMKMLNENLEQNMRNYFGNYIKY